MTRHSFEVGKRQWIALRDLQPHPSAQRRLDPKHVAFIARDLDPAGLGTITVAETKRGRKWIVDGQHRAQAILQWLGGDASQCVDCLVIPVEDDAAAARLFLLLNRHKSVKALDKFLVRVVEGDAIARGISAILDSLGLHVAHAPGDGVVQAVDACESLMGRARGSQILERTLRILHAAWGRDRDAYRGELIRGLGLLVIKYGACLKDDDLIRKMATRAGPLGVIGYARNLRSGLGGSLPQAICEVLKNDYNKGRRVDRLEDGKAA